jgi:hypothetical protein
MKVGVLAMMFACLLAVGLPLAAAAGPLPDMDSDTILDQDDNCKLVPQTVGVNDCDTDGYGNLCDCDFNVPGDNLCGAPDFNIFKPNFGSAVPPAPSNVDMTCDGLVGAPDFNLFKPRFGGTPGPSGLTCAGAAPCP